MISTHKLRIMGARMLIVVGLLIFLSPLALNADILNNDKKDEFQGNVNEIANDSGISTSESLESIIGTLIRIVLASLGTVFLILMFLAGNKWMRAGGNKESVEKAQKQIQSLVIGLIIILAAYAISYWISGIFANILVK